LLIVLKNNVIQQNIYWIFGDTVNS